jgi:hypothetical protein
MQTVNNTINISALMINTYSTGMGVGILPVSKKE